MRTTLTHAALKLSKTRIRLHAFVCYALAVKRMKLKTNSVFQIFLVVFHSFMYSHKNMNVNKFRIPTTKHFFEGGRCETFKGVNCVVYDGECREMGR